MQDSSILKKLKQITSAKIETDPQELLEYGRDWTREDNPDPLAVIFPESIDDIVKIVKFANDKKVALVPSGGRTGLSGGAVALNKELVLSFDKMNKILEFNDVDKTVKVQAGVTTEEVKEYAEDNELFYPIDLGSKGTSQIGGNIATNAGGVNVIRYGPTKNYVKGLKVVTGEGKVLELNKGLTKNATGYDLLNLFIGSEGTLGFIIEAILQLVEKPKEKRVLLLAIPDLNKALDILLDFRKIIKINAFEFFSKNAVGYVKSSIDISFPLKDDAPFYLLIDFELTSDSVLDDALKVYQKGIKSNTIFEGIISQSDSQTQDLWKFRENITEAISRYFPYKNDISVRPSQIPHFLVELQQVLNSNYSNFKIVLFGHIGDGNIHINILKPENVTKEDFLVKCKDVNGLVFELVAKYDGSISAEHGIGLLKRPYLNFTRSENEIHLMKEIKNIFDPNGIMNPGKIFS